MPKSTMPKPAAPKGSELKTTLLVSLALVALTVAAFWPALACDFVSFDDPKYVTANSEVRHGLSWHGLAWAFTTGEAANWHPLTWLSLMLDRQLFGDDPWGYHAVNLALHTVNVLLVFLIFKRTTGAIARSALVAALFAVHPLRVESVVWVSERKDVLCACFGLAAILAYAAWTRAPSRGRYGLVLFLYALSLLAKPMLVTLPFLLLLLDFWPLGRLAGWSVAPGTDRRTDDNPTPLTPRALLYEKLPLFALAAASTVVTFLVQLHGAAVKDLKAFPWSLRLANAPISYIRYLEKMVHFDHLAFFYPYPAAWPAWMVAASGALLALSVALVVWRLRPNPWLAVGWFWYLGLLVPVIGLVQVGLQSLADRYTYLPSIGVALLLVWSIPRWFFSARIGRLVLGLAVAEILVMLGAYTWMQTGYWSDSQTAYEHSIAVTENNYPSELHLGGILLNKQQTHEALAHFDAAVRIDPKMPDAYYLRAGAHESLGEFKAALADYDQAVKLGPDIGDCYAGRAMLLASAPDPACRDGRRALGDAQWACELSRWQSPVAINALAASYAETGDFAHAVEWQEKAIELTSQNGQFIPGARERLSLYRAGEPFRAQPAADDANR